MKQQFCGVVLRTRVIELYVQLRLESTWTHLKTFRTLQVSWMRKRDLHILTTNIYTYTGDQRFSVIHPPSSDDWDLKIDYAQTRDSGIYECQVNTEPKINLAITLEITGKTQ